MTDWRGEVGIQPWLEELAAKKCEPTLASIAARIAQKRGITVEDIRGKSRVRPTVHHRHEFFYHAMLETTQSSTAIGRWAGGSDHTTCLFGSCAHARRHGLPKPRVGNFNKG